MAVSGGFRPGEMTTILSRGEMTAGLAWGLPDMMASHLYSPDWHFSIIHVDPFHITFDWVCLENLRPEGSRGR